MKLRLVRHEGMVAGNGNIPPLQAVVKMYETGGPMKIPATLSLAAALAVAFAACGDDADRPTPTTPVRTATAPAVTTTVVSNATSTPATSTTPIVPSATIPAPPTSPASAATATLAADRRFELAPIDGAEMIVRESAPPQYAVHITSGLPSGCAQFADATATRDADTITITVRNTMPADAQIACTQIYGQHESTVELGTDFVPGTRYTVRVNDRTIEFIAQ